MIIIGDDKVKEEKGFTLVELLGVILILSIVLLIAIPNVTSTLDKTKKENYISDAKKLITQAEYELRRSGIEKPASNELVKITLSYLGTSDVSKDADGNQYDKTNSYVVVVRKNGYLEYYVNLVANTSDGTKGIQLVQSDELEKDNRLNLITVNLPVLQEEDIQDITGVTGEVKIY